MLDSLYQDVLSRAFRDHRSELLLKKVMAALFAIGGTMPLAAFRWLYTQFGFGEEWEVDCTLPHIASILDGISDTTQPIRLLHSSLSGFLLDPQRSGPFCVKGLVSKARADAKAAVASKLRPPASTS